MAAKATGLLVFGGILAAVLAALGRRRSEDGAEGDGAPEPGASPGEPGGGPGVPDEPDAPGSDWESELDRQLQLAGVRNFTARELTWLPKAKPPRLDEPPLEYWDALVRVAVQAQALRDRLGIPLTVSSAWRPKWYNDAVGGASNSAHIRGAAIDLNLPASLRNAANENKIRTLAAQLWLARTDELAGLGFYKSPVGRVHLDVFHPGGQGRRYWDRELVEPYLKPVTQA